MKQFLILLAIPSLLLSPLKISADQNLPEDIFIGDPAYRELKTCLSDPPNSNPSICYEGFIRDVGSIQTEAEINFALQEVCHVGPDPDFSNYLKNYSQRSCVIYFGEKVTSRDVCERKIKSEVLKMHCQNPAMSMIEVNAIMDKKAEKAKLEKRMEKQTENIKFIVAITLSIVALLGIFLIKNLPWKYKLPVMGLSLLTILLEIFQAQIYDFFGLTVVLVGLNSPAIFFSLGPKGIPILAFPISFLTYFGIGYFIERISQKRTGGYLGLASMFTLFIVTFAFLLFIGIAAGGA